MEAHNTIYNAPRLSIFACPRTISGGIHAVSRIFKVRTNQNPLLIYTGEHYYAACHYTQCDISCSEARVTGILLGEYYKEPGAVDDPAEVFISGYISGNKKIAACNLRGSFALALLSPENLSIITDRVASRKIFRLDTPEGCWLDNDLRAFLDQPADPAGVASIIINRFTYNERTLIKNVYRLPRARIHSYDGKQWSSEEYWSYVFHGINKADFDRQTASMQEQLWDTIQRSIRKRQPAIGSTLLSLSGGMDSRVILAGLLANCLEGQNLSTTSYGSAEDDDAKVAYELARTVGLPWSLAIGRRSLPDLIEYNADHCGGQVFFYPRGLDGFEELVTSIDQPVTVYVGDECYGWNDMPLQSRDDVLTKGIGIRCPAMVPAYYSYGAYTHESIASTLQKDNEDLLLRYKDIDSLHDLKDVLYLDQRLSNMLLPWRELHIGSFARVVNPHIDEDILDFMKQVPTEYRLNKRLFRETASRFLGQIGNHRYAKAGGCSNDHLESLFVLHAPELDEYIEATSSALDDVLPVDVIRAGLATLCADIAYKHDTGNRFLSALKRKFNGVILRRRFIRSRKIRNLPSEFLGTMSVQPIQMATILQIRAFLAHHQSCDNATHQALQ